MALELIEPRWPAPAAVRAVSTTRRGGTSCGAWHSLNLSTGCGDHSDNVAANRERLRQALGIGRPWHWLRQVHGTRALDAASLEHGDREADAVYTARPDTVCAVTTADCVPVLLCARDASVVAAAHAGWRGLAAGVLERTVEAMALPRRSLVAWLGPAISASCYEVGPEVRAAFLSHDERAASAFIRSRRDRWLADLYMLARQRLAALGVSDVHGGDRCTHREHAHFFSHRRDRGGGRMATLIWIEGASHADARDT